MAHACRCVLSGMATSLHEDEGALLMMMHEDIIPAGGIGAAGRSTCVAHTSLRQATGDRASGIPEATTLTTGATGGPAAGRTTSAGATCSSQQDVAVARSRAQLALRYRVARKRLLAQWGGDVQNFAPPPRATAATVSQVF